MILETILSTEDVDGKTHYAPIGVIIPGSFPDYPESPDQIRELQLRLYPGSRTYENLLARGEGVVNLTENVMYFADASLRESCGGLASEKVKPRRLADTAGFWEFSVTLFETVREPALVKGRILYYFEPRGFFGLCRAHGAVLEAAVAVSRRRFISKQAIETPWPAWRDIVEKTGGVREQQAFDILTEKLICEGFSL